MWKYATFTYLLLLFWVEEICYINFWGLYFEGYHRKQCVVFSATWRGQQGRAVVCGAADALTGLKIINFFLSFSHCNLFLFLFLISPLLFPSFKKCKQKEWNSASKDYYFFSEVRDFGAVSYVFLANVSLT